MNALQSTLCTELPENHLLVKEYFATHLSEILPLVLASSDDSVDMVPVQKTAFAEISALS